MNSLSKFAAVATGVIAIVAFSLSPVFADSPGQLATGPNVYEVQNVTANSSYAGSVSASACDVVQFSAELNNGGFGGLTNVIVKSSLPSNSSTSIASTVTATSDQGASTTGTATVNVSSAQSLSYVSGSTVLKDGNGNVIKTLSDGITSSGINVGNVNGSVTEFVDFKAKVSCPQSQTFSSSKTVTIPLTQTVSVQVNCPKGDSTAVASASATDTASVTGSGSATSTVSQADADAKALAAAQTDANSKVAAATSQLNAKAQADANAAANLKCSPAPPTSTVTTSTPPALPNTGPGDVAGELFAGTSALGAVGHYVIRRFRR